MTPKRRSVLLALLLLFNIDSSFSNSLKQVSQKSECSECPSNPYKSSQIYVFAGQGADGNNAGTFLTSASHFNSSTNEWKKTTSLSVAKYVSAGAVVGTKIHLFGGFSDRILDTAEVYDCETGTYSQYRSMPEPRRDHAAAVLNGHIYVAGGDDGSRLLSSVFRYDIQTTRLETVASIKIARKNHQMIELNGRLYVIGGESAEGKILKSVEVYNPGTGRWAEASCTNDDHERFGATIHEGKIYVCSAKAFEVYDPKTDEWTVLPSPSKINRGRSLLSVDGKLWAIGGDTNSNYRGTKTVMTFNTATNKWSVRPDMDVGRAHHTAFVVNH